MDIQLPVMDGIEATKEIRKLEKNNNIGVFPSTPLGDHQRPIEVVASSPFRSAVIIVALTASSLQTDRVAALAAGCNDFLTKPVSLKWLEKKTVEWGCMQVSLSLQRLHVLNLPRRLSILTAGVGGRDPTTQKPSAVSRPAPRQLRGMWPAVCELNAVKAVLLRHCLARPRRRHPQQLRQTLFQPRLLSHPLLSCRLP